MAWLPVQIDLFFEAAGQNLSDQVRKYLLAHINKFRSFLRAIYLVDCFIFKFSYQSRASF